MFVSPFLEFETSVNVETVAKDDGFVFGIDAMLPVVSYDSRDKGYWVAGILSYTRTFRREIFVKVLEKNLCGKGVGQRDS